MNDGHCTYNVGWILQKEVFEELPSQLKKLVPPIVEAPSLELKYLIVDFKYAF